MHIYMIPTRVDSYVGNQNDQKLILQYVVKRIVKQKSSFFTN